MLLPEEGLDFRQINPKGISNCMCDCVIVAINGRDGRKRIKMILFIYSYLDSHSSHNYVTLGGVQQTSKQY